MKGILESPQDKEFSGNWTVVDVRDVATAHLLAAEKPHAQGRSVQKDLVKDNLLRWGWGWGWGEERQQWLRSQMLRAGQCA
jgi:hypothetical protein